MATVIARYRKQADRQVNRSLRRNRPLLKKEIAVREYCGAVIEKLEGFNG